MGFRRKTYILILSFSSAILSSAQQLPYFTQFKQNSVMLNPAVTGTKRLIDVRSYYRNQWVGFDASPKTLGIDLNSRFYKGKMGAGFSIYRDITGFTSRSVYTLAYSYHLQFPDIELSLGMSANMIKYAIDGSQITLRNQVDQAVSTALLGKASAYDAGAGMLLYNDRFHFGISVLDMLGQKEQFYKDDPSKQSFIKFVPHTFVTVGYNWAEDPRFVWENSVQANVVSGSPLQVDYNLRLHYKGKVMAGFSIRRYDAIALHVGFTIREDLQISYSYDIGISPLYSYHSNSHEVMIVYSTNLPNFLGRNYNLKEFRRQKFGYMF